MKIICLFGQRTCSYPGQHAPELLAAIDEYGDSENPAYLNDEEKKYQECGEFDFMKRISIEVSTKEFDAAFYPKDINIHGTVTV